MKNEKGFTLVEVMISMFITLIVMAAVFGLLQRGQSTFNREPEVAGLQQAARVSIDMIATDLAKAGFYTPAPLSVVWSDGGNSDLTPDEITIVYADPDVPISMPTCAGKGKGKGKGCGTISKSSTLFIDPDTFWPAQADPTEAYYEGQVLFAFETADCNGDGELGIVPFEVTQDPEMAGGKLRLNHNPGNGVTDLNIPGGFNREIQEDCAVIGAFHVVQYRIRPLPPTTSPTLERRDLAVTDDWVPVAPNIENLQFIYGIGADQILRGAPDTPDFADPLTWITRVGMLVSARSTVVNLEGASDSPMSNASYLRQTLTTMVTLRNNANAAQPEWDEEGILVREGYYN